MKFVHGWNPDSEEKKVKDYNARLVLDRVSSRPASASLRKLIPSILNQEELGSCTCNAVAQALRMAIIRAGGNPDLIARLFLYYYARAMSPGNTQVDSGTQIRCVFDVIRKLGFCPETVWPYDISTFTYMPSADALRAAYPQKSFAGYFRISSTGQARIDDVCTAIAGGYAVVFGTPVSQVFCAGVEPGKPIPPPIGLEIAGGHALTAVGYSPGPISGKVVFDIANSWGTGWGENGYCTFDESYIAWDQTSDLWIIENAPGFSAAA